MNASLQVGDDLYEMWKTLRHRISTSIHSTTLSTGFTDEEPSMSRMSGGTVLTTCAKCGKTIEDWHIQGFDGKTYCLDCGKGKGLVEIIGRTESIITNSTAEEVKP